MTQFIQSIAEFTAGTSLLVYVFIFVGKIVEVSLGTLSTVLINKGIRIPGILVGIVEYVLWLLITTSVMIGYKEDPIKILFLVSASAIGKYIGMILDEKLAFGLCSVSVYLPSGDESMKLADYLRDNGFAMTILDGHGIDDSKKYVLLLTLKRKRYKELMELISKQSSDAVITVTQVSSFTGGYLNSGSKYPSLMKNRNK
ncbi:MAG: DUF2179 domain-containing protein [Clostridia bacterium]|nr:DUF2179 domain-containing protein [Clostridia bacterium]MBR0437653.1 DUF2179 domain-containing protein [Clostridia bacterium]MBR3564660.1 DUF2179 domain-containing protein [Clostridia bacterium]MBR4622921.1 DUF2179 domain-containing protein [Clostridia bacterium]MBR6136059.1 DUF2179 domain-containing protein [Clostridia bacterium]